MMRQAFLVLACLACGSRGYRTRSAHLDARGSSTADKQKVFRKFLRDTASHAESCGRQRALHSLTPLDMVAALLLSMRSLAAAFDASSALRAPSLGLHRLGFRARSCIATPAKDFISRRSVPALASGLDFPPASRYTWRGHSCSFVKAGQGPPILLLHGFAGSAYNCWRSTLPALAATHTVYALDFLGLGASDQPADVEYSIDLWREQSIDLIREKMSEAPIVIGHSFGSVVALEVARELAAKGKPARAVGMMNCGVGMNNKNALKVEDWRREQQENGIEVEDAAPGWQLAIFGGILSLVDFIFNHQWLLMKILDNFATGENVRGALQSSVYINPERVTDDLVEDYLSLAKNKTAAVEVLRQIYTNDGGPLPFPAVSELPDDFPILAVWGNRDNLAPMTGPVGKFFRKRSEQLPATRFEEVNAGHVPQDDIPEFTNSILEEWLTTV